MGKGCNYTSRSGIQCFVLSGGHEVTLVCSHPYLHKYISPLLFQGKPVEILPFLYLGSAYHASREDYLSDLHVTALLNVSRRDLQPSKGHYDYKWIPVEDSHMADISSHFQEAIDFIGESPCFKNSDG